MPIIVAPGESAQLEVRIGADYLYPGRIDKRISISCSGSADLVSIDIVGQVDPAVRFSPPAVDFGGRQAGDAAYADVTVVLDPRIEGRVDPMIAVTNPDLEVTRLGPEVYRKDEPAHQAGRVDGAPIRFVERRFRISLVKSPHIGPLTGSLTLKPKPGETLMGREFVGCNANVSGEITAGVGG